MIPNGGSKARESAKAKSLAFQVKTASRLTRPMTRGKGIIQGCPWLVIISEQGVDKWLRWTEQGHTTPFTPDSVQGYVDDMDMTATNEDDVKEAIQKKTDQFMPYSALQVKHRKCAVLHGQRSGNKWSKKDGTASIELIIQSSPVPRFSNMQPYT